MTEHERDVLAHLAADWDAQAADIERSMESLITSQRGYRYRHAIVLRGCAEQLRNTVLRLRTSAASALLEDTRPSS